MHLNRVAFFALYFRCDSEDHLKILPSKKITKPTVLVLSTVVQGGSAVKKQGL